MGIYYSAYIIPADSTDRPSREKIVSLIDALHAAKFIVTLPPVHGGGKLLNTPSGFWTDQSWIDAHKPSALPEPPGSWTSLLLRLFNQRSVRTFTPQLPAPLTSPLDAPAVAAISSSGALFRWSMQDYLKLGTRYPLAQQPDPEWVASYSVELHFFDDFVNLQSDYVDEDELQTVCVCGEDLRYECAGISESETRIYRICPSCGTPFRPQDQTIELTDGATHEKYLLPGGPTYRFAIVINCGKDFPQPDDDAPRAPQASDEFMATCATALGIKLNRVGYYS